MNLSDTFWLSYRDLTEKKVRTALTILMVMIGVASIVALVSQTTGISASIQSSLDSLGPTSIILTSSSTTGFSLADIDGIESLQNVSSVTPIIEGSATATAGGQNTSATVIGISSQGLEQLLGGNVTLESGTTYNNTVSPASLIGYSIAYPTALSGKESVTIGEPITLKLGGRGGSSYTIPVLGVLSSYSLGIVSINTAVVMPLSAAEAILHKTSFNTILVKATNTSSVDALTTQLTDIYGNNARVISTQQLAATAGQIIGSITLLLVIIAGISLLVAAIGIMNIMLMSVLERTHEIGIMKSLGFRNRDVLTIFLFQALLIGFFGGLVGIAVGGGASLGLSAILSHSASSTPTSSSAAPATTFGGGSGTRAGAGGTTFATTSSSSSAAAPTSLSYTPVLSIGIILEALFVAMSVSAIAGLYPAWRASKLQPIEALRQL